MLGYLTLITGISISAVAIYYSVLGLVAIFAAAALPIIVMGGTLEIAKLVTAVWLHKYWDRAVWWLKTYLITAVVILMFITSMGIFGFLSKAHIEQTTASQESVAKVEQLTKEITRQQEIIIRAETQIKKLETSGTGNDAQIQAQIDKEQERIDNAYKRIQPAIDEQNRIIGNQAKLYQDELTRIDEQLATLQKYIDAGDKDSIKKAQAMIGAAQDGAWGSRTSAKADEWKAARRAQRTELLTKIEQATNNPQARAAANEIKRLRQSVETQIAESNKLINRLRSQIGKTDKAEDIDAQVEEQIQRMKTANAEIDTLTKQKYDLESEFRKLEAEVGPIKYIAEFIYGEKADATLLEEAVRWVIVIIIFVFDPLAVLLLIASQYTFRYINEDKERNNELVSKTTPQDDPEDTPPSPQHEPAEPEVVGGDKEISETGREGSEEVVINEETHPYLYKGGFWDKPEGFVEVGPIVAQPETMTPEEEAEWEDNALQEWNKMIEEAEQAIEKERIDVDGVDLEDDEDEDWDEAKTAWKKDHPKDTLKRQRRRLELGIITVLPWETEQYQKLKKNYQIIPELTYYDKEGSDQVKKTATPAERIKPDLTEVVKSYSQNEEQTDNTLWSKVKKTKDE